MIQWGVEHKNMVTDSLSPCPLRSMCLAGCLLGFASWSVAILHKHSDLTSDIYTAGKLGLSCGEYFSGLEREVEHTTKVRLTSNQSDSYAALVRFNEIIRPDKASFQAAGVCEYVMFENALPTHRLSPSS